MELARRLPPPRRRNRRGVQQARRHRQSGVARPVLDACLADGSNREPGNGNRRGARWSVRRPIMNEGAREVFSPAPSLLVLAENALAEVLAEELEDLLP